MTSPVRGTERRFRLQREQAFSIASFIWDVKVPMNRTCSQCSAVIPDDAAVFCDRCGMPLPPPRQRDPMVCGRCGRILPDMQSRFCDRCGSLLMPPAPHVPHVPGTIKRTTCPVCGFPNAGASLFFCRKCGSSLVPVGRDTPPVPGSGRQAVCPSCGFPNTGDHLFFCRKCGSSLGQGETVREPRSTRAAQAQGRIVDHSAPVPGRTIIPPALAYRASARDLPSVQGDDRQKSFLKKGPVSLRKLAIISLVIIFLLLGIAFLTGNLPGWGGPGENTSVLGSKSPAQPAAGSQLGKTHGETIGNRATAVLTDSSAGIK